MIDIKVKLLTENAKMPSKAHSTDACYDIYNAEEKRIVIKPRSSAVFHTGFATEIPQGYFAPVFSRSGMGFKQNIRLCNSVGVIDSDYRGEWMVKLVNDEDEPVIIEPHDRIAQFTILPVLDVSLVQEELNETERGNGGFGSSGN